MAGPLAAVRVLDLTTMVAAGDGAIIATGNTSAFRGKANFAGFAPTKAAQRILTEAMARELGPKGVHIAYVMIDAVIDLGSGRAKDGQMLHMTLSSNLPP